uniref:Serine/threonine-protein phosphatase 7 long form homolog n=1 Tax=Nicotiana sylvestris TaxID=4096 RepID=A0A1U7VYJ4_NICSY|nr:PREDICTED: serine/threonine-protein phosphatase 7 long form homolog [Nicotiana sylvestris]
MEAPPIHPGPFGDELLSLQADHRVLHARVVARMQVTGFYRMIEIGWLQLDWSLITTFIEWWTSETHTFHLPIGEATVTLQDMEVLYGLLVDDMAISFPHSMREMTCGMYLDTLQRLTAFRPHDKTVLHGASRFPLTTIRLWLEEMHPQINDDIPDYYVDRFTRLLLLLLFGGVLFPNTSGNLVSLGFLHHLERLDDLSQYSWGSAILAYLYRCMCRASMGTQCEVDGFFPLLQFQPPLPPLAPVVPPELLPLARRWVLRWGHTCENEAHHNLSLCRDILDLLDGAQVNVYLSLVVIASNTSSIY